MSASCCASGAGALYSTNMLTEVWNVSDLINTTSPFPGEMLQAKENVYFYMYLCAIEHNMITSSVTSSVSPFHHT